MAFKESVGVRDGRLNSIQSTVGASPLLRIYTGSPPTACSDAATGTLLVEMTLPSTWLASASGGSISKTGTWEDTSANNSGTAGYFRIYDTGGAPQCHLQGTVTATGGGGDMTLNSTSITSGDDVVITSFTITAGNA